MTLKLPDTIKIGYRTYTVSMVEAVPEGPIGAHNLVKGQIVVKKDLPDAEILNTFLHEIFHGIYQQANLLPGDDEERIVNVMTNGIQQVIQDNPDLRKLLSAA